MYLMVFGVWGFVGVLGFWAVRGEGEGGRGRERGLFEKEPRKICYKCVICHFLFGPIISCPM